METDCNDLLVVADRSFVLLVMGLVVTEKRLARLS